MSPSRNGTRNSLRKPHKLQRSLRRLAAADFRLICPGEPEGPPLSAYSEAFPGVPTKGQLSRWRNGDDSAPLVRLYWWIAAAARAGHRREELRALPIAVRNALAVIYAHEDRERDIERLMEVASDADHAEEIVEREAWRRSLRTPALKSYHRRLRQQNATGTELEAAIASEIIRRELEGT